MGRKERRALERKIKHLAKTKPNEIQTLIKDIYDRGLVENRMNNEDVLAPGDKVVFNMDRILHDPDFNKYKPEYKAFIREHVNDVFTLRQEAKQQGPFSLVSFEEDDSPERWLFYIGHLKKVKEQVE